jgi:hypothetical protein
MGTSSAGPCKSKNVFGPIVTDCAEIVFRRGGKAAGVPPHMVFTLSDTGGFFKLLEQNATRVVSHSVSRDYTTIHFQNLTCSC